MSLRDQLIEAGARAIWDEWEALTDYEALDADARANAHADIEIVLDAILDALEANAEEWASTPVKVPSVDITRLGRGDPEAHLRLFVAALRDTETENRDVSY